MNQNPYTEGDKFTPNPSPSDNSVNYLRRLKEQTRTEAASPAAVPSRAPAQKERRRSPRYKCSGSAEITQLGGDVRMWGTLTDISLHGCYVEMSTTFPVDTRIHLVLEALNFRFRASGIVRISYPFLGMGVLLTELEPDQRAVHERLLATLAQATTVPNPMAPQPRSTADAVAAAEPIALLNEIRRFFDKNGALSREEFLRIAERCRRA